VSETIITGNVARGAEAFFLKSIKGHILYITNDGQPLEAIAQNIKFINPDIEVTTLPEWDCLPYDRVSPRTSISKQRMSVLATLSRPLDKQMIIVTSPAAVMQMVPPLQAISASILQLHTGNKLPREQFLHYLQENGFNRYSTANEPGEYAVRGSIIDLVLDEGGEGIRIDFFGDVIDSIRSFDAITQLSQGKKLQQFSILPASEVIFTIASAELFKKKYLAIFGLQNDPLLDAISTGKKHPGMEHWLPLFYPETATIFDYLPQSSTVVLDDAHGTSIFSSRIEEIADYFHARQEYRKQQAVIYNPLPVDELYLDEDKIKSYLSGFNNKTISRYKTEGDNMHLTPAPSFYGLAKLRGNSVYELMHEFIREGKIDDVKYDVEKFIITCFTEGSRDRLAAILKDNNLKVHIISKWQDHKKIPTGVIGLMLFNLERGFTHQKTLIASEQDILGERQSRSQQKKRGNIRHMQEINTLAIGDYVVHIEHGIGLFSGLETITVHGVIHDFIKLVYLGDDKLYVPVENFELISRYSGGEAHASLDKLGSLSWQKRKAGIKQRIKLAAEQLLSIAAERKLRTAPALEPMPEFYEAFCHKFPYVETDDQLRAINDVLSDLSLTTPADRLICGDVGFGKTEVAMRAAAAAVGGINHVQVALVVPTTLLARQHYQNFCERFDGLPVKIAQLSKFVPANKMKSNKEALANGDIDIVIGTHALLAKDIKFKNLGLIIIDEEQHFGVAQKEKLKQLKSDAHILTLSATPIPRTMQMSLSGIKELSLITTPPMDRLPVNTVIMPFDPVIIREAIIREQFRGGRTFYITPRIQYIDDIHKQLSKIVPEIKIGIAHGQMSPGQLDKIMNEFYDGAFDLLISTTIIESGLDISIANTMIIDRPEMFGLAQLYQIRGRVGRSKIRAYAYLITKQKDMTDSSKRRLEVIQSLDYTGAGMMIATHDMDIRGYGNLVGEEQSGHIKEVGVELYQSMLTEAVENLSAQGGIVDEVWSPLLNIGVPVQLPSEYIGDVTLKLSIYKQLTNIADEDALEEFALGLIDRFGSLPEEAVHMIDVLKLKLLAKAKMVSKIDCGERAAVISFHNNQPAFPDKIINFIASNSDARLRPDGKLLIMRVWKTPTTKFKGLRNILESF